MLFGSVPLLVLLVALFSIPGGLSPGGKIVWAYVSYALFSLAYSFVNIPYGSLAAAMTQVPDDRAKLSTSRVIAASLTILLIAVVVSPQISGGGDLQRSLTITTAAFAIIGFALYLWCFATSRETVQREVEKVSLRQTLGMMRHNRPLVLLCAATLLFLSGMFSLQTVAVYYARDVLGNADLYIVLTVVSTAGMILASALVPKAVDTIGKKRTYLVAGVIAAAGAVGFAVAPGIGPGDRNRVLRRARHRAGHHQYADLRAAGRHRRLRRVEQRHPRRGRQLLRAVLHPQGGPGHRRGGRRLHHRARRLRRRARPAQTSSALTSIRVAAGIVPAALFLAASAVMLAYPLTEKAFRAIVAEMAERRAAAELASAARRMT